MSCNSKVSDASSLQAAVSQALAEGSTLLLVPFFGGNSAAFDQIVESGQAKTYTLWVEFQLNVEGGAE